MSRGRHSPWNLPQACRDTFAGQGRVRGLGWRDMPGQNDTTQALNWWLWKRGLIANFKDESAAADALRAIQAEEEAEQAA